MRDIVNRLRDEAQATAELHPEDSEIEVMREAATEIERLRDALERSVVLQSHYAGCLNAWDGGKRMEFPTADAWITRLASVARQ